MENEKEAGRWTAARGRAVVQAFEASGLDRATFAEREGIRAARLSHWIARTRVAAGPVDLRPVLLCGVAGESGLAVHVGGVEVRVRRGFDADLLREVVEALAPAC